MGRALSEYYTFEQAANRLNRSKRSIHVYVKDGFIGKRRVDGQVVLLKEDVEQLAIEIGADMPAMNRKTFFQLQARIKKLEDEMHAVKHILEIRDQPLRPTIQEAQGLHAAASESMTRRGNWNPDEIRLWADQFEKMDEVSFDSFSSALADPKPWMIFYQLCMWMMETVSRSKTPEMLALHKRLDEGRKKMRGTVLMWIEMGRGSVPENVFRLLDFDKETVIRRATTSK